MASRLLPLVAALSLGLAACSSVSAPTPFVGVSAGAASAVPAASLTPTAFCVSSIEPGTVAVTMLDFRFYPTTVSAKVGDVIEFIDRGGSHNATLVQGSCATPTLSPGGHASLTIRQVGAYPYRCTLHIGMEGSIVVTE